MSLCACGHGIGFHDLDSHGERRSCFVYTGPLGTPCSCPFYAEGTPFATLADNLGLSQDEAMAVLSAADRDPLFVNKLRAALATMGDLA